MFRTVRTPADVNGNLLLHSLPGRYESWVECADELRRQEITRIISVMPEREALEKSAFYARAAAANELPCARTVIPIREYDVPQDRDAFFTLADETALSIRRGERILVHCAAGRGRTGMFASCVMIALGLGRRQAERVVALAGGEPENVDQKQVVAAMARRKRRGFLSMLGLRRP